jgi:hypothetical protein
MSFLVRTGETRTHKVSEDEILGQLEHKFDVAEVGHGLFARAF